jgi:hypothetical protein
MKKGLQLLIIVVLFSCHNRSSDKIKEDIEPISDSDTASIFSNTVSSWLNENLKSTLSFKLSLEDRWTDDSLHAKPFTVTKTFLHDYSSVLRWSPDSSYILDIGSYGSVPTKNEKGETYLEGGEPDTEIALINPEKNQRIQYLYVGPSGEIINGKWLNNSEAIILGTFKNNPEQTDTLLWLVDVKQNLFRLYNLKTEGK